MLYIVCVHLKLVNSLTDLLSNSTDMWVHIPSLNFAVPYVQEESITKQYTIDQEYFVFT